ncbi:MAG: hypothetical protein KDD03_11540, partial [Gelidibacter sp.]|nr:hypothetical protein [Gelidibacter sp.]
MPKPTTKKAQSNKSNSKEKPDLFSDTNVTMKSGRMTKDTIMVSDDKFAKLRIAGNKQYLNNEGEVSTLTNYFNILISKKLEKAYEL